MEWSNRIVMILSNVVWSNRIMLIWWMIWTNLDLQRVLIRCSKRYNYSKKGNSSRLIWIDYSRMVIVRSESVYRIIVIHWKVYWIRYKWEIRNREWIFRWVWIVSSRLRWWTLNERWIDLIMRIVRNVDWVLYISLIEIVIGWERLSILFIIIRFNIQMISCLKSRYQRKHNRLIFMIYSHHVI